MPWGATRGARHPSPAQVLAVTYLKPLTTATRKGGSMSSSAVPQGSFVLAWAGEDPALHSALLEQLDAAGIPYADKRFGADEVALTADPLPIDWKPRFGFEVAVLSTDLQSARGIVENLLEAEPVDMELPAEDAGVEATVEDAFASQDQGAGPVEIWSGDDLDLRRFVLDALRENEVPVQVREKTGVTAISVLGRFAGRAKEIVREISEAAPPK